MYLLVHHYFTFHIHSNFSFWDASSPRQQWQRNDNYHDLITSKLPTPAMMHQHDPESSPFRYLDTVSWQDITNIHLMNASAGIVPCLFNSVKTYVACWISQPVSSRHLKNLRKKVNLEQDRQCLYKCNTVACLCNHFCHGKAISNTYSLCVRVSVALFIQLSSTQSTCTILCCHPWPVWLYHIAPHYLINGMNLGGKWRGVIKHKKCVLISPTTFACNVSHSMKNRARYYHKCIYIYIYNLLVKYPL